MQYIATGRLFYLSNDVDPDVQQITEIDVCTAQFPESSCPVTINAASKWTVEAEESSRTRTKRSELMKNSASVKWVIVFIFFSLMSSFWKMSKSKEWFRTVFFHAQLLLDGCGILSATPASSSWLRSMNRPCSPVVNPSRIVTSCPCQCAHRGIRFTTYTDIHLVWKPLGTHRPTFHPSRTDFCPPLYYLIPQTSCCACHPLSPSSFFRQALTVPQPCHTRFTPCRFRVKKQQSIDLDSSRCPITTVRPITVTTESNHPIIATDQPCRIIDVRKVPTVELHHRPLLRMPCKKMVSSNLSIRVSSTSVIINQDDQVTASSSMPLHICRFRKSCHWTSLSMIVIDQKKWLMCRRSWNESIVLVHLRLPIIPSHHPAEALEMQKANPIHHRYRTSPWWNHAVL